MSELKRCPFCGGQALLDREDIFCDECHLSMRIDDRLYNGEAETYEQAREQAIEAWNTRTPMERIVERLKEKAFPDFEEEYTCNGEELLYLSDTIEIVKEEGGMNE